MTEACTGVMEVNPMLSRVSLLRACECIVSQILDRATMPISAHTKLDNLRCFHEPAAAVSTSDIAASAARGRVCWMGAKRESPGQKSGKLYSALYTYPQYHGERSSSLSRRGVLFSVTIRRQVKGLREAAPPR